MAGCLWALAEGISGYLAKSSDLAAFPSALTLSRCACYCCLIGMLFLKRLYQSLRCVAAGEPWLTHRLLLWTKCLLTNTCTSSLPHAGKAVPACHEVVFKILVRRAQPVGWVISPRARSSSYVDRGRQDRIICAGPTEKVVRPVGFYCIRDMLYSSWCPVRLPFFRRLQ